MSVSGGWVRSMGMILSSYMLSTEPLTFVCMHATFLFSVLGSVGVPKRSLA